MSGKNRYEMRFTGSGGQGIILASVILAEAAVIQGKNAIQSQSYGPEARGGTSKAEAIISDERIWYSKVIKPDFLLALSKEAVDKYVYDVSENAVVLIDDCLELPTDFTINPSPNNSIKIVKLPILRAAREDLKKPMAANIVAVGAINGLINLFSEPVLREAVKRHIPSGTESINMSALKLGEDLSSEINL